MSLPMLPPPSLQPSPQPQHQLPLPPPPRSHSHSHSPHLRVQAQHHPPISYQTTTSPSPPPPLLRTRVLAAQTTSAAILGSGGSRLLVYNYNQAHAALETRLAKTFRASAALLFNSGFDANAGFFACIPQPGDALLYDAAIHASVHDGARASRVAPRFRRPFAHNDVRALREECVALMEGQSSVFVAVESVYSMDGTVAPLCAMIDAMDEIFPARNVHLVVDEAHATGIYGPGGRGMVAQLGLEDRVLARLHTFGKALAASGGAFNLGHCYPCAKQALTLSCDIDEHVDPGLLAQLRAFLDLHDVSQQRRYNRRIVLVRSPRRRHSRKGYFLPLTLSLSGFPPDHSSRTPFLPAAAKLATQVLEHSTYFQERLSASLTASSISPHILSLPTHLRL